MTSLAEYFQAFHSYAYENALTASARTLYYTILGEFNAAYWKRSELSKSVRELREIGGFKSEGTVQKAKAELGTENILQIGKIKNCDVYKLVEPLNWRRNQNLLETLSEQIVNSKETLSEHLVNTLGVPNYARVKDNKDSKTSEEEKKERACAKNFDELDSDVRHAWIQANGENPFGGDVEDLLNFQKRYGAEKVVQAITHCRRSRQNDRVNISYVESVLRGGDKRGKIVQLRTQSSGIPFDGASYYGVDPTCQRDPD